MISTEDHAKSKEGAVVLRAPGSRGREMASSKVAEYARKMREKRLAEVRKACGGAEAHKMTPESDLVSRFFGRGILFSLYKPAHKHQLYECLQPLFVYTWYVIRAETAGKPPVILDAPRSLLALTYYFKYGGGQSRGQTAVSFILASVCISFRLLL